jgi:hypothetical protein
LIAGLAALIVLRASDASAQRAVVLAPHIEPELTEATRTGVLRALEQALLAQGARPEPAPAPADACQGRACDPAEVAPANADAVQLTVWRATDGGVSGVSVAVHRGGLRYSEGARVSGSDDSAIADAVLAATRGAYERARRGPGPWLAVTGRPDGSAVLVDDKPVGSVPGSFRVAGGLHHVVVRAEGFAPFDATITVPRNPDALKRVQIALQPASTLPVAAGATQPAGDTRPSPLNFAIAGAAVVVGSLLAIGPVRTAVEDGECGREESGRCTGIVEFDAGSAVQLGAATVLIAGGVGFALWAPLRVQVYSDGAEARLAVRL